MVGFRQMNFVRTRLRLKGPGFEWYCKNSCEVVNTLKNVFSFCLFTFENRP